ncbi:hypothetical protein GobsT_31860 [Gemmata obscuriglobus]|uniref:Uncharacterized protein n=1 Tax=Gemmata obscuriglobus TaxID=114 RepID=A0A2Z3HAC9_9BACT|nr:hypothetical protein [Gemmata obscuriglobus]AWM38634.1 hypothetical protein C1280_17675 [Gemmata obscuriglobus]QEG28408.1 hypothetical protein GobsT_31860 [Gemmata obscuriglobus]VTS06353.1 unnamed protein product [Gemmata obscuriglobus UQM 2246]
MAIRSISHFLWQVLRATKRSKKPPTGRQLRISPTPRSKDGSFLTALVDEGLLKFVTGSPAAPFEATFSLTEKGEHAAEYGEYEYEPKRPAPQPPPPVVKSAPPTAKKVRSAKKP